MAAADVKQKLIVREMITHQLGTLGETSIRYIFGVNVDEIMFGYNTFYYIDLKIIDKLIFFNFTLISESPQYPQNWYIALLTPMLNESSLNSYYLPVEAPQTRHSHRCLRNSRRNTVCRTTSCATYSVYYFVYCYCTMR